MAADPSVVSTSANSALEIGQIGVWRVIPDEDRVQWDECMERLHGLSPGKFRGNKRHAYECVHPDDRASVQQLYQHAFSTGTRLVTRYRVVHSDGSTAWLEARAEPESFSTELPRWMGVCVDITEIVEARKRISQTMHREETMSAITSALSATVMAADIRLVVRDYISAKLGAINGIIYDVDRDTTRVMIANEPTLDDDIIEWLDNVARTGLPLFPKSMTTSAGVQSSFSLSLPPDEQWAAIPLLQAGVVVGVWRLIYDSVQTFDNTHQTFLINVARKIADTLERTLIFDKAENTKRFLQRIQNLTSRLTLAMTPHDVGQAFIAEAVHALQSVGGAFFLINHDAQVSCVATVGNTTDLVHEIVVPDPTNGLAHVIDTCQQLWIHSQIQHDSTATTVPTLIIPLADNNVPFALAKLLCPADYVHTEAGQQLIDTMVDQATQAFGRAKLYETVIAEQQQLETLMAELPVGVIIAEAPSGKLVLGNKEVERILKKPFISAINTGQDLWKGFHPDGRAYQGPEWPLSRSLATGEIVRNEEIDIIRGDGSRGIIEVNSSPLRDARGDITGGMVTFVDVTVQAETRRDIRRLHALSADLAQALTVEDIANIGLRHARAAAHAGAGIIGLYSSDDERFVIAGVSGLSVDMANTIHNNSISRTGPIINALNSGESLWVGFDDEYDQLYPEQSALFHQSGYESYGIVPLIHRGITKAFLMLCFTGTPPAHMRLRNLLVTIGKQVTLALDRAILYEAERQVSRTLQHNLLPPKPPTVPGTDLAVWYQPAAYAGLDVGGDWYETLVHPDGVIGVAVSDVVGRGVQAAAAMGQLRSAFGALFPSFRSPGQLLTQLDEFASRTQSVKMATLLYVTLEVETGAVRYARAGHLPAVLLLADGSVQLLDKVISPPLGTINYLRPEGRSFMPPGSTLLLYTDGLIERRGEPLDNGLRRLLDCVSNQHNLPPQQLGDHVISSLLGSKAHDDDVALLCLHRAHDPQLKISTVASSDKLTWLRSQLRDWLDEISTSRQKAHDIVLAASEAWANAIEHSYNETESGAVHCHGWRVFDQLMLQIRDEGRWRSNSISHYRGRGRNLMEVLSDEVSIVPSVYGTTVTLRWTVEPVRQPRQ